MKRAITLIAIITLVFLNWSCDNKTKFQNVKYQSQFELDLPEYMTEMDLENPEAQLQYGSILQDHYALVIYEDIEELKGFGFDFSIEDYMGFALENVLNTISNFKYERLNEEIQNVTGIDYISYKIWGTFDSENIDVYYS